MAQEAINYSEPYLCHHLSTILNAAAHKNAKVRSAAETAMKTFATKMSSNALPAVLPHLFKCSEVGVAWQTRALALKTIASFGDHSPEQLGCFLPEVIFKFHPYLSFCFYLMTILFVCFNHYLGDSSSIWFHDRDQEGSVGSCQ